MILIHRIDLSAGEARPLGVRFAMNGEQYAIDVDGDELQNFIRFQAAVLERLGVLVRFIDDRPWVTSSERQAEWLDHIGRALKAGRVAA